MVTKAKSLGLNFLDAHLTEIKGQVDTHDQLYNSRAGLAGYYRYSPRPVTTLGHDTLNGVTIDRPKVHKSAFERIRGEHVAYAPIGIPPEYDLVLRDGRIVPWEKIETNPKGPGAAIQPEQATTTAEFRNPVVSAKQGNEEMSQIFETGDQARLRATRMEAVWNIVWWRRVVYFLTLFSSLYLVALPLFADTLSTKQTLQLVTGWLADYLRPILMIVGYMVPAWVGKTWLDTFAQEPVLFLIGLLCVAATILIGLSQEETIRSRAGEIWHHRWESVPKWAVDPKSTRLYKLRSNPTVLKAYRYFAWRVLPTLFLAACAGMYFWLWWWYPGYTAVYSILCLLAIGIRSWVFRAQYTARKQTHSASGPKPPVMSEGYQRKD